MSETPNAPDAALLRWVRSSPAVACAAPAFRAWATAPDPDGTIVAVSPVSAERFARGEFSNPTDPRLTTVAGRPSDMMFAVARVPKERALVLRALASEDFFIALIPAPPGPPPARALAALPAAPRARGLGLGSTRSEVERALGPGRATSMCGYEIVRYEVRPHEASVAEMWFFYRNGRVAALTRYEAV